ncbi:HAD-IC family P-type ATPase [Streptomyces sp. NPDC001406]|uniref:HAD-IC family P-type ATPase n=1 Tax=Streptomyces sp. NPDC001406 TaxID=3364572 RepID=UPI0036C01A37
MALLSGVAVLAYTLVALVRGESLSGLALRAVAVARELGIAGEVVTGTELDRMSEDELAARIDDIGVFARVAPGHKVAIVRALSSRGHIVAMTGDGVNDAAALRAAHIGAAMGRTGTDVAKEAADMVLTDDDFSTIVRAVREGRAVYANIVKFVRFQPAANIGAILTLLGASLAGLPAPLTAAQLLWINIIMDGPPARPWPSTPPATTSCGTRRATRASASWTPGGCPPSAGPARSWP